MSLLHYSETFVAPPYNTTEYANLASTTQAPNKSCFDMVESKGWIDSKDKSTRANMRKSVIADMEVSRVRQPMYNAFIYPNINACTIPNNIIDLYYNVDPDRQTLDAKTCELKGITAKDNIIYHRLTPVDAKSPYNPAGCMINFDEHNKESFERLLDDAYELKMYPDIVEKKNYSRALQTQSQTNMQLSTKYQEAANKNKEYEQKLNLVNIPENIDTVASTCRDVYTEWQDAGDWAYNALDKHDISCGADEVMSQFQLLTAYQPDKARYKYRCCKIDSAPFPKRMKESVDTSSTAFQNSLMWNTMGLTAHTLNCPKSNDKQTSMLKQFKLEPQYVNQVTSNSKYNYKCSSFKPEGIPGSLIETECRKLKTREDESSPAFNVLDRHNIVCEDGEGISNVGLKNNGIQFFYEYSCCRPKLVRSE